MGVLMKNLFYIFLFGLLTLNLYSYEWEKVNLPSHKYFRVDNNTSSEGQTFWEVDSLPEKTPNYDNYFYENLRQAYLNAGSDTFNITIIYPYQNVAFATNVSGLPLFTKDAGVTWEESITPTGICKIDGEAKINNQVFVSNRAKKSIEFSTDSCQTWQTLITAQYFPFMCLRTVNDSTLFYVNTDVQAEEHFFYHNINTSVRDSNQVSNLVRGFFWNGVFVKGDTVYSFSDYQDRNKYYRSTDRGANWEPWIDVFNLCSKLGIHYSNLIVNFYNYGDILVGQKEGTSEYFISPDLGKNWYYKENFKPIIIDNKCYFAPGIYRSYNLENRISNDIPLLISTYGTFRNHNNTDYYQNQEGTLAYTMNPNGHSWNKEVINSKQRFITKSGNEYHLTENNEILLNNPASSKIGDNYYKFELVAESAWIDILKCYSTQDNNQHFIFVKDSKVVDKVVSEENIACIAGYNRSNPNFIYTLKLNENNKLTMYSNNFETQVRDTTVFDLGIAPTSEVNSLMMGNKIYIITKHEVLISEDKGKTFSSILHPQSFKNLDDINNNAVLYLGDLYLSGSEGLLKLTENMNWTNILEGTSDYYVFAVEFHQDKIYAYTEEGLFISDAEAKISTEVNYRNAILEHTSAIHCDKCVDGDQIVRFVQSAHIDTFFPVAFHPDLAENIPADEKQSDFRTEESDDILNYIGLDDLSYITINRRSNYNIRRMDLLSEDVEDLVYQNAPLNMGVNSQINPDSRELKVTVKYYYTSEIETTQKLSVYLLQNNIVAYQSGRDKYPYELTLGGDYIHQNVFRMLLSDSISGDIIGNTSEGIYGERTYTAVLPGSIKNINLDIANLQVVAFIQEDEGVVLNAASARVEIPDSRKVFLTLEDKTENTDKLLNESIRPIVKVTNTGTKVVTQFDIKFKFGDTLITKTVNKVLGTNQSTTVVFNLIKIKTIGNYLYKFYGFANINNSEETGIKYLDWDTENNRIYGEGIRLQKGAFITQKYTFEQDSSIHYAFDQIFHPDINIIREAAPNADSLNIGAENTETSIMCSFKNSSDSEQESRYLVFGEVDLTSAQEAYFSYFYACEHINPGNSKLVFKLEYSSDDGASWEEVNSIEPIHTYTSTLTKDYPNTEEYIKEYSSLQECLGKKVILKFTVIPFDNHSICWLDQIAIDGYAPQISASSETINFGKVSISNTSYTQKSIDITNAGNIDLKLKTATIAGSDAGVFNLVTPIFGKVLAAGESMKLDVGFKPEAITQYLANLVIESNDPDNRNLYIRLEGEGTGTSIEEQTSDNLSISISPNPSKDYIIITSDGVLDDIKIFDTNGQLYQVKHQEKQLDISALPSGTYFLKVKSNGKKYCNQFVVAK